MVGMAVGDALGAPLECLHAQAGGRWEGGAPGGRWKDVITPVMYGGGYGASEGQTAPTRLKPSLPRT